MLFSNKMSDNKQFLSPASVSVLRSVENIPRYSNCKMCLFGKPEPAFTEKLMSEIIASERQRMMERWGFDILAENYKNTKKSDKARRRIQKSLIEDKENIKIREDNEKTLLDVGEAVKENLIINNRKKSLKMPSDKQYLRRARQSQVTDFWRSRKFSESSSCSDKEN